MSDETETELRRKAFGKLAEGSLDAPEVVAWLAWATKKLLAMALAQRVESADDVVQDVWESFFKYRIWESLDESRNPRGYLFTMLRNACRQRFRATRREGIRVDPALAEVVPRPIARYDYAQDVVAELQRNALEIAWSRLGETRGADEPGGGRWLIRKTQLEGIAYSELTAEAGRTENDLRQRQFRAMKKLRRYLDEARQVADPSVSEHG